ncbi:MAG: sugar kinase [Thaumarchaeota archaeon]|jgi:NAD(P)H-hydrate repair Nnr-like enzyme with NAD(P)H-hydrate dehydratase domain|nr:sugar kinase [Nitrososphaerota archaeon]
MSLVIVGTVPIKDLPLYVGTPKIECNMLILGEQRIPCTMGTAALFFASHLTCQTLGVAPPVWVTAGDIGDGVGSRIIYQHLASNIKTIKPKVLTLHYLLPIILLAKNMMVSIKEVKPALIADAGSMYVMKSIKAAKEFDLFTPDPGEMAFLADPRATHPAYIQHYLFESDTTNIPGLIEQAYKQGNVPRVLLVKGAKDYIAKEGKILAVIDQPNIPTLEPIGGTGDTITGIVSALIYSGLEVEKAAIIAAKTNRLAGKLANPTTATRVLEIALQIPKALVECLH